MSGRGNGSVGGEAEAVRVWLLGRFRVSVGSSTLPGNAWRLRKAAGLVKLLALAPGHRLHREQVMDLLWPDLRGKAASNNLRQALYAARKKLRPDGRLAYRYLASEGDSLALCPGGLLWVDVEAFEEGVVRARRSRDPAAYAAAIDLYADDLLPEDRYEVWAEARREELRQLYLALLLELAGLHEGRGEHGPAIEALRKAAAKEPALEEAHAGLMRLHALSGRPEQALVQYQRLRDTVRSGLGTQPAATTRRLRDEIAAGGFTPVVPTALPQEKPSAVGKHNLPASRTSFVGRERETVEVKRALAMTRLLTLTGAGGSGKTRLALEAARDLVGAYPDGAWLSELAPLSEPGLVAQEVAGALDVSERPGEPLTDTLVESVGDKELLLIVDNCEHVVEAAARLVDALLGACPRLRVLATSREPLGLGGEVLWRVPPLSLPATTDGEFDGESNVEGLVRYEAVGLFVDRARLRLPDFGLTRENAGAVARVCRKLDGIPLAIELATARMGVLAVEQVAQRLEVSLDVLTGASRVAEPRQRTLRATLDWSHELLSEAEQALFRRLSVFAGGWTLEAAEAVCPGDGIREGDVLDLLGGLVDKSLVVAGWATGGAVRYGMLEPIRQYAWEKLETSREADRMQSGHAAYFLALAEEAEPELAGPQQKAWIERLEAEHDDIRAALSWALRGGDTGLGLRLAGALRWFWEGQGNYDEGRRWFEQALAKDTRTSTAARAKALDGAGWLAFGQGDLDRAREAAEEGLELSPERTVVDVASSLRNMLGNLARSRGDYERATELFEESLALDREAGDKWAIAWSLGGLAAVSSDLGNHERAVELYEESIALSRVSGHTDQLADSLINLGFEFLLRGDHERATALNEEAVGLYRKRGQVGDLQYALDNLGWAALLRGDHDRAEAFHEESLELSRKLGVKLVAAESLEGLACTAGARGEAERAARLFGAARALHEAVGYHHTPAERALREPYLADARSRLAEAAWEAAFAEGRAMTFGVAAEYALSQEETATPLPPASARLPADERSPSLSRREEEVAVLVTRGMTNRQIASELTISERTAASHVGKILKKLGLRSRAQIATWATERRLLTPDPG